jgi:hypothetical protein
MDLLTLAQDAIQFARGCVPLKSDNKVYGQISAIPPAKAAAYTPEKRQLRQRTVQDVKYETASDGRKLSTLPDPGCHLADMLKYGHRVMEYKAGNCVEQSAAALIHISWQLKEYERRSGEKVLFNIVRLEAPGDHAFVALNQPLSGGKYPKDFAKWSADAVICDPWAKLACKASDYPTQWKAKMDKWANRGLSIGLQKPTAPQWYKAIEDHEKLPYVTG